MAMVEFSLLVVIHTHIHVSIQLISSELVSCKIDLEEGNLVVIAVYRPPTNNLHMQKPYRKSRP